MADIITEIAKGLKERDNPKDLKSAIIAQVVKIEPKISVAYCENKIILNEDEELIISEWFRFRCNIDKTEALSQNVPDNLNNALQNAQNAKLVTETHSYGGAPCQMPNAISHIYNAINNLKGAINSINNELIALKCNLNIGDEVVIVSLEEKNKFVLIDKVLNIQNGG